MTKPAVVPETPVATKVVAAVPVALHLNEKAAVAHAHVVASFATGQNFEEQVSPGVVRKVVFVNGERIEMLISEGTEKWRN